MLIRELTDADIPAYLEHCQRHFAESGAGGDLIFHPLENFRELRPEEERLRLLEQLHAPLGGERWVRIWIAERNGSLMADALVRGGSFAPSRHRCLFAIGVERPWRRQGLGRALSLEAIRWAGRQPELEWVDLRVFAHNEGAIRLYEELGFRRQGLITDKFRIQGRRIDDLLMALPLRGQPALTEASSGS